MKKIILVASAIIILTITLWYIFQPKYNYIYIYSPDKTHAVTQIDIFKLGDGSKTIFTPGIYSQEDIPPVRIVPEFVSGGISDGFILCLEWEKNRAIFYSMSSNCTALNLSDSFQFIKLNGHKKIDREKWVEMKSDTTGKFIKLHNKEW